MEIHTAEVLVPGTILLEVEIAITKLNKYKSPGSAQTPATEYSKWLNITAFCRKTH
jgi:hypothetical protein